MIPKYSLNTVNRHQNAIEAKRRLNVAKIPFVLAGFCSGVVWFDGQWYWLQANDLTPIAIDLLLLEVTQ